MFAIAVSILVASTLVSGILADTEQGSQTGEITVWIGDWQYVLYNDGTACIISAGDGTGYNQTVVDGKVTSNKEHVVDDIPCFVEFNGVKYTVTELGPNLFAGTVTSPVQAKSGTTCRYFTEVYIPNTIQKIGASCFQYNQWLGAKMGKNDPLNESYLTIHFGSKEKQEGEPDSPQLNEIAEKAFYGCGNNGNAAMRGLQQIELPSTVTSIGTDAFRSCKLLTEIDLSNVHEIDARAFYECTKLVEVDLGSAESIADGAFGGDTTLKIVNLNPRCVYTTSSFATSNITFSGNVEADRVIEGCGSFFFFKQGSDVRVISFSPAEGYDGNLTIPKEVTVLSKIGLLSEAKSISFESGSELVGIEGVSSDSVFGTGLVSADFSNATKLKTIGPHVFYGCSGLESIDLSKCTELEVIDTEAFRNSGLETFTLPESLRIIGDRAFAYTPISDLDLTGIKGLTSIGDEAFIGGGSYATSSNIVLSDLSSLGSIGSKAFYDKLSSNFSISLKGCTSLSSIGASAFAGENEACKYWAVDLSGCSSLAKVGAGAFGSATYDSTLPFLLEISNNGSVSSIAKPDVNGALTITEEKIAIDSSSLSNIKTVTINGSTRFVYEDGILMDSGRTYVIRVVESGSSIVIPSTVSGIHSDAFTGVSAGTPILIDSDVGTGWILDGMSGISVDHSLEDLIAAMDKKGCSYSIHATQDGKTVTIGTELGFAYARPTISIVDNTASITMTYSGGYSDFDILISGGGSEYLKGNWTFNLDDSLELTIKARDRNGADSVMITFDPNGGSVGGQSSRTIQITKGLTIIDSDLVDPYRDMYRFEGWKLKDSQTDYDFDSQLTGDLTFVAQWSYIGATITFDSAYGEISAVLNGNDFESGSVLNQGQVQMTFNPYPGYTFTSWNVGGKEVSNQTLKISNPDSDLSISVNVSSYSADALKSLVTDNPSIDVSKYSLSWKFGGVVDTSMQSWSGHPSNPVVADDYVYVRIGPTIYQLSLETGMILNTVASVNQTDYYHHLGYGNGMLVDYANGKVYDSSMKHLFTLTGGTISFAYYTDGMFVCMLDGVPAAYDASYSGGSAEDRSPKWKSSETGWFKLYGTASTPVFYDGYMYFVCVDGKDISIKSISLADGTLKDSTGSLLTIRGQYLDDGWMSLYNGTLYLTSYAYGLFGATQSDLKSSVITSVQVKGGEFVDSSLKHTKIDGYDTLTSQFVVFNGRGYVYSAAYGQNKSALLVYDTADMTLLRTVQTSTGTTSVPSHGSIVVDASQATKENNYAVKVYLLAYSNAKLYVMEDDCKNTSSGTAASYFGGTYCSQAVRFGQNGEMIWYDDSGYVWCYSSSAQRYVFIADGDGAKWHNAEGSTASGAVEAMDDSIVTIESSTKAVLTVNGKAGEWKLYALKYDKESKSYSWTSIENLGDAELDVCHYFAIADSLPSIGSTYAYIDGAKNKVYQFSASAVPLEVVGKDLVASTDVVKISFTDSSGYLADSSYLVVKDKGFVVEYPAVSRPGYSATWLDGTVPAPKGEVSYSSDKTFTLKWVEIAYDIDMQGKETSGKVMYTATVTRTAGTEDLDDLGLLVVVRYSDAKYLNLYSKISSTDGMSPIEFATSSDGLEKVFVYVISGDYTDTFDRYGEASITYSE